MTREQHMGNNIYNINTRNIDTVKNITFYVFIGSIIGSIYSL